MWKCFGKNGSYGTNAKYYLNLDYGSFGDVNFPDYQDQHRELSVFKETLHIQILWPGSDTNVLQDILSLTLIPLIPCFTQLSSRA